MAKRRKKRNWKRLRKNLMPAHFFVKKGHVQWNRVLLLVGLVLLVAITQTDVVKQAVNAGETTAVDLQTADRQEFVKRVAPEAKLLESQYGVKASISIAQAALESNWGQSELSARYNNFFGVKASAGQNSVTLSTKEYLNGQWVTVNAAFRVYGSWQESMIDHAQLLANGTTDKPDRYYNVVHAATYQAAAQALYDGGYATDPGYPEKIIKMIQTYQLDQYDAQ